MVNTKSIEPIQEVRAYMVHLKIPHGLGEQTCRHQVQEARRDDQEDLQRCKAASSENIRKRACKHGRDRTLTCI